MKSAILVVSIVCTAACSKLSAQQELEDRNARQKADQLTSLARLVEPWGGRVGEPTPTLSFYRAPDADTNLPGLTAGRLREALAHEGASYLVQLDISNTAVGDPGLAAIAASPHLGRLVWLDASEIGAGDEGARALASAAAFRPTMSLDLTDNRIGPEGAAALANSDVLAHLEHLRLSFNPIGNEGARAIANGKTTALRDLWIDSVGLDDNGLAALLSPGVLVNLKSLSVNEVPVPEGFGAAFAALSDSSVLPKLERISMSNELPDEARYAVYESRPAIFQKLYP